MFGNLDVTIHKLDDEIENTISQLSTEVINKDNYNYAETIRNLLTNNIDSTSFDNSIGNNLANAPENVKRFNRYVNADEIEMKISQCGRALKVLSDSITSPDNINKKALLFLLDKNTTDEVNDEIINNLKTISDELEMEDLMHEMVYCSLKYGDYFVELCDYKSKEIPITQSLMLSEGVKKPQLNKKYKISIVNENFKPDPDLDIKDPDSEDFFIKVQIVEDINHSDSILNNNQSKNNILKENNNIPLESDDKKVKNKKDKKLLHDIKDVRLITHDPRRVIKIQSERYRMNLGYLILPVKNTDSKVSNMYSNNHFSSSPYGGSQLSSLNMVRGIDAIYKDVIKMVKKYVDTSDIAVDDKELKILLQRAIQDLEDTGKDTRTLKIRYVPPERMEHFAINTSIYFPYGEGIFEKSLYSAKSYIALKDATTIKRLSDATEKRIIHVDTTMPRNSRNLIESLKEKLKKIKYNVDSFGNIGSISSMITNFQEFIIPMNKQREYVRFDTLPPSADLRSLSDELKTFRDDILSSISVPPSYVNIEEGLSNKNALALESFMFAETINSYQQIYSKYLYSLFNKLYKFVKSEKLPKEIIITFPPPKFLRLEKEAEYAEAITRIINSYSQFDIPKEHVLKKYLSEDWDEIEDIRLKEKINQRMDPSKQQIDPATGLPMGGPPPPGIGGGMNFSSPSGF
jgi:hypothetical protein